MKKLIAFRHFRQCGDDIEPTDPKEVKAEKEKQFKKKGDPWFFEMLMQPRYKINGIVQSYESHPDYIKRVAEKIEDEKKQKKVQEAEESLAQLLPEAMRLKNDEAIKKQTKRL